MAHSPRHYTRGTIEVWDFIRDQGLNYHRGNAIKYICRAGFKSTHTELEDLEFRHSMREVFEQELKELADLVYVCFQYAENMEWDLEEALDRVHKSNLSKLGLDGKPIRRKDGKVMKGPNYQPPNLLDLVNA